MFKQVKSALFWYYLYKFRRRFILISLLLIVAIFANAIYSDVIQYLTLKDKLQYLEIALIAKWFIIIFNIIFSIYLLLTLFKNKQKDEKVIKNTKKQEVILKKEMKKKIKKDSKFTKREEEFLNKKLRSKADQLIQRN